MRTHQLSLVVSTGDLFDVRRFEVTEGLHDLFRLEIEAVSGDPSIDFDAIMGQSGRFSLQRAEDLATRFWDGLVTSIERIGIEEDNLSTYRVVIQPELWLLTQSRNYRIFQHMSDPAIALEVLARNGIVPRIAFDPSQFKGRKYRVQYAESDYAFVCRLLEDAGITFCFEQSEKGTRLVLVDGPQARAPRRPVRYDNSPSGEILHEIATNVRVVRRLRPGRYTQRDVDYRRASDFPLVASTSGGTSVEARLERFHSNYGAFLFSAEPDGSSPTADDHGAARTDLVMAERQVNRRLAAKRHNAKRCVFETTAHDLAPGVVFGFAGFPAVDLADGVTLLVVRGHLTGRDSGEWKHEVDAFFANERYHPPLATPKPRTRGVESATVVGAEEDEIHTDEFARVRVHFHWDRDGGRNDRSSCWIPVSQPWGGAGFGAVNIPRVGQEVLIDFLGADPDRPVVVGRVFTKTQPVPYALPKFKTVSGIRSQSSMRVVTGANDGVLNPGALAADAGVPMDMTRLQDAIDGAFPAVSPNGGTHRWHGSELSFDDQFGREMFYLQAERNLNMMVKNDMTTVVGNGRATRIGTDDVLTVDHNQLVTVENNQLFSVNNNRGVVVEGAQAHIVKGNIRQASVEANQEFTTALKFSSEAKEHEVTSTDSVLVKVDQSILYMSGDFVILQTPYLFLNPGMAATEQAIEEGKRPLTAEEARQELHDAAVEALMADIDAAWQRGEITNPDDMNRITAPRVGPLGDLPPSVVGDARQRWDGLHRPPGEPLPYDYGGTGHGEYNYAPWERQLGPQ